MHFGTLAGFAGISFPAACGGSSNRTVVFTPQTIGLPAAAVYNEGNDTVNRSGFIHVNTNHSFLPDEIDTYSDSTEPFPLSEFVIRGVTPSGSGIATAYSETESLIERIGTTTMQTTGTVRYDGRYAGLYASQSATIGTGAAHVLGDAVITAAFDDSLVFVTIENRTDFEGTVSHFDLFLRGDLGANGSFSRAYDAGQNADGSLFGQNIVREGEREVNGIFTGATGEEVVGTVSFKYVHGANSIYRESGVFFAER